MLKSLHIRNYALIDQLSIDFETGFNILTGETGAGKSIILGALGLILGQRADLNSLRRKEKKCTVEGIFSIAGYQLERFFQKHDLDFDEMTILRREIVPSGKSRAFINDTPVTLDVIQQLALMLIDIHSQHQNLELNNRSFQLKLVDLVAKNTEILREYSKLYNDFQQNKISLKNLKEEAEKAKADLDYFQFQFNQLDEARLNVDELEKLESEQAALEHAEDIKLTFGQLAEELDGGELPILSTLKERLNQLSKLTEYLPEARELHARLESCYIELKDMSSESEAISEKTEHDPGRIQFVADRLDLIYSLQQKFRVSSVGELVQIKEELEGKINQVTSFDEEIARLEKVIVDLEAQLKEKADILNSRRKSVAKNIQDKVVSILNKLNMANAEFSLQFNSLADFGLYGRDEVRFLFSANKNSVAQEISKIASGGEMSRLMLALKTLINDSKSLPTIIFDEIDTGISGETALKMGEILKELSENMQVINITHLPQIAGKGDHHYQVYKFDENNETYTSIRKLNDEERVEELAQMLSGDRKSETARGTARELLD
ncbi:DNA repair protein RecN [Sunxiuqinia sp. A32]|uniref:DNA repair protein RecN n=1 Tax=Sunxiuqinia sp. A32 TaxID=3461496 RepID=UPI00404539AE